VLEFAPEKFNLEPVDLVFSKERGSFLLKYTEINCLAIFIAWVISVAKDK